MEDANRVHVAMAASMLMTGPDLNLVMITVQSLPEGRYKHECVGCLRQLAETYSNITERMSKIIKEIAEEESEKEE